MSLSLLYNIGKDVANLIQMTEGDPVVADGTDITPLIQQGLLDGSPEDYRWSNEKKLFSRTETDASEFELVWLVDSKKRIKRKLIINDRQGNAELYLIRKKREA